MRVTNRPQPSYAVECETRTTDATAGDGRPQRRGDTRAAIDSGQAPHAVGGGGQAIEPVTQSCDRDDGQAKLADDGCGPGADIDGYQAAGKGGSPTGPGRRPELAAAIEREARHDGEEQRICGDDLQDVEGGRGVSEQGPVGPAKPFDGDPIELARRSEGHGLSFRDLPRARWRRRAGLQIDPVEEAVVDVVGDPDHRLCNRG